MKTEKQLIKELKSCKNDVELWGCVLENSSEDELAYVQCDNDETYLRFSYGQGDEGTTIQFDDYIGSSDGIFNLLDAAGIKAIPV
jgi:hypothetical protein